MDNPIFIKKMLKPNTKTWINYFTGFNIYLKFG